MNETRQFDCSQAALIFIKFLTEGPSQFFDNKVLHVTKVLRSCTNSLLRYVNEMGRFKCKILPIAADLIPLDGVDVIIQYLHHPNQ